MRMGHPNLGFMEIYGVLMMVLIVGYSGDLLVASIKLVVTDIF